MTSTLPTAIGVAPVQAGLVHSDPELLRDFELAMQARTRVRDSAAAASSLAIVDSFEDSMVNAASNSYGRADSGGAAPQALAFTEITEIAKVYASGSHEPDAGFGYDLGGQRPNMVGGFMPTKETSYAYKKIVEIRTRHELTPTIEPTVWTLKEFSRIEKYNLELLETKKAEKKGASHGKGQEH